MLEFCTKTPQILIVSFDFELEEVVIRHDFLGIEGEERERGSRIHLEKLQTGDKILGGSYFPIVQIPKFIKYFSFYSWWFVLSDTQQCQFLCVWVQCC